MKPQQQSAIVKMLVTQEFEKRKKNYELRCVSAITTAYAVSLHDKWGWSKDDINKLIAQATEQFADILDKYVTLEDFTEWAKEYGIVGL